MMESKLMNVYIRLFIPPKKWSKLAPKAEFHPITE